MSQMTDVEKGTVRKADDSSEVESFPALGPEPKVLMIWPRFPSSFWSMDGVLDLVPIKTDQPPLGLLTVAALCPRTGR